MHESLFLNVDDGVLSTEYQDFVLPTGDFSGSDITMSPELTLNGLIQYDISLGNEEYMVYAFDLSFFGINEEMLGTPRAFGLELTYRH